MSGEKEAREVLSRQRQIMKAQDETLDSISETMDRLKNIGYVQDKIPIFINTKKKNVFTRISHERSSNRLAMNQELDTHNNILNDLDTNVDITKGAVKRSTDKTKHVRDNASGGYCIVS